MATKYKRVLLKLSGEQLAGEFKGGIDPGIGGWLAEEVKKATATGCQIAIVVGGGNMVRGAELAGNGIKRVTADQMGMLSGLMNAMALTDIFESKGLETRCMSNIFADQVAENYSYRRAEKHLNHNRVVLIAGGSGRPYFTHDTVAVNQALELDCQVVLKATKVDGVYDKDPLEHSGAKKFDHLDYQQAVQSVDIKIMDKAAVGLAMEHRMPVLVFDAMKAGNIARAVRGESVGTLVS